MMETDIAAAAAGGDDLARFMLQGQAAQVAIDQELDDGSGVLLVEGECPACTCTEEDACEDDTGAPCSWRETHEVPLCSSCAPPTVTLDGVDVEDLVIDALDSQPDGTATERDLRALARLRDVPGGTIELVMAFLVEDGLMDVLEEERDGDAVFRLASRRPRATARRRRAT